MNKNKLLLIVIALFNFTYILMSGCSEDEPTKPPTANGVTVSGYVRSINGTTAIQNVNVNLRSEISDNVLADSLVTLTNELGYYEFTNVSNGAKKLYFSKGSFKDTISITVSGGSVVVDTSHLQIAKPFAYLFGQYDDIQTIIRDSLGYSVQSITTSTINSNLNLQNYSVIFLNCGTNALSGITNTGATNLKSFMQSGGRIYASDFAYGTVIKMYPELSGIQNGNSQTITGNIVDQNLQHYMNASTVQIFYNLGSWYSISPTIDQSVNIPFLKATYTTGSGTITNNVVAFYRTESLGKLIFTTFHNEANVTAQTIKILKYFIFEL